MGPEFGTRRWRSIASHGTFAAMRDDPLTMLEAELGAAPPAAIAALDQEHLCLLAELLRQAKVREAEALAAATEQALSHVPWVLRGLVKKALGE
jgi:hypothetical protein